MSENPEKPPIQPPIMPPPAAPSGSPPTVLDKVIPAQNGPALLSYYIGLFSIMPVLGLFMGIYAITKGREGIALTKAQPGLPGRGHAAVGIGCGALGFLFNFLLVGLVLAAFLSRK